MGGLAGWAAAGGGISSGSSVRLRLKDDMNALADSVLQKSTPEFAISIAEQSVELAKAELLKHPRYGEYTQNLIDRYKELRSIVDSLKALA